MARLERSYQGDLIKRLNAWLEPDGAVLKMNPNYLQGIPDILVLYKNRWALLECKRSANEPYQANQEWYLNFFNQLSFASVIFPEIEDEVLDDLQQALRIRRRRPRVS